MSTSDLPTPWRIISGPRRLRQSLVDGIAWSFTLERDGQERTLVVVVSRHALRVTVPRRCQSKLVRRSRRTGEAKQHGSHSSTIRLAASCSGGTAICRDRLVFSDSLARSFGNSARAQAEIGRTLDLYRLDA